NPTNQLQRIRIKIAIEIYELPYRSRVSPPFFLPSWLATDPKHVHNCSMAQRIVQQNVVDTNEHCKGTLRDRHRDTGHWQKRTKSDLARVIYCLVTEDLSSHLGGATVTTDQNITCNRASIGEPRYYLFEILCKRFKTMIEEYTFRIVS